MRLAALLPRLRREPLRDLRIDGVTIDPQTVRPASNPITPNQLWVADLTIARTDEGWHHLAVVLDCYSRRCLGWWSADELRPDPVIRAVQMAAARRWPSIPLAEHPDQQPLDISLAVSGRCRIAGVAAAPGAEPSTMDAAVAESFFTLLRRDLLDAHSWLTRADAYDAICTWIEEYYNPGTVPTSVSREIAEELDELNL